MQAQNKQLIPSFKTFLSVEPSLRHKIITAVNVKYISDLRDHNNHSIKNTIDVILKHLFYTYGKITPQIIIQHEDVVKQMTFDVNTPINTIFNDVEELVDISATAINPYTDRHCIKLAYNVLNKTGRYKIGLR